LHSPHAYLYALRNLGFLFGWFGWIGALYIDF